MRLELPSEDECTLEIVGKEKTVNAEVTQIQDMYIEAIEIATKRGVRDSWKQEFVGLFQAEFGIELKGMQVNVIVEATEALIVSLRKKFYPLPSGSGSTESQLVSDSAN
jgi:hypothetical protein